ncbi:hypothetical protein LAZ67_5003276 [Cordylochernes scorpioides]|uniref:Uncharacterized protein n=1 Tax=Cordylochernes scorpioides TaxID=51811 RepID=A0ABY6KKQ2_9ARAC|nr:hypothetical protein LAZ67_5003276 [Cordylochernes scorpioides]
MAAWMDGQSYLRLAAQDPHATLIPVAPAYHDLPLNTRGSRAGHLVNVIIHKDNKIYISCGYRAILEYFTNLRGYKWAYDREESFTGHFYTLHKLRQMGENANFFSNIASSGSQRGSIQMVRDKIADAAAVDAACLNYYLEKEPDSARGELHILETWGPFSPYPLVANSRLPENVRNKIAETLLELHTSAEGRQLLSKFGIKRFLPISPSDFSEEKSIVDPVKDLKFKAVYY